MLDAQVSLHAEAVTVKRDCAAFGVDERTYRHRRQRSQGRLRARHATQPKPRAPHPASLSTSEKDQISCGTSRSSFDCGGAITLASRLPIGLGARGGWGNTTTTVAVGSGLRDLLTGRPVDAHARLADILDTHPVAVPILAEVVL